MRAMLRGKAKDTVHNQWSWSSCGPRSTTTRTRKHLTTWVDSILHNCSSSGGCGPPWTDTGPTYYGMIAGQKIGHILDPAIFGPRIAKVWNHEGRLLLGAAPRGAIDRVVAEQLPRRTSASRSTAAWSPRTRRGRTTWLSWTSTSGERAYAVSASAGRPANRRARLGPAAAGRGQRLRLAREAL